MRKLPTRKLLTAIVAGALFLPTSVFALGLGEIEVSSALNQRLSAEIELLSAVPEDTENIIVKLASRKQFSRAGVDRPYLLNDLRFKSEVIDGVPHIKISSGQPIREPFINFLIEIDWPNGHLLREYTVLLDPPVFMTQSTRTVSAPASALNQTDASVAKNTVPAAKPETIVAQRSPVQTISTTNKRLIPAGQSTAKPAPTFIPAPVVQKQTPVPTSQPAVTSYRVKSGDTAWKIAEAMRPNDNVSVPQMLMALLKANPETFINGNVNGLKRGYILRAPDATQIVALSKKEASAMLREQSALWRQYQQAKAGKTVAAMTATNKAAGTGNAAVTSAVTKDNARLSIVAGNGTSTAAGKNPADMSVAELRAELALAKERVETERVEKEALKQRVGVLEQHTSKMKGLLTIEDEQLAGVQALNKPVENQSTNQAANEIAEDMAADESSMAKEPEATPADETSENNITIAENTPAQDPAKDAIFTDEVTDQAATDTQTEEAEEAEEAPIEKSDSEMGDVSLELADDPLMQLLNNPTLLAAAGGGLLLLVALIALFNKRRKENQAAESAPTMDTISDLESLADDIAEETAITDLADDVTEEDNLVSAIDDLDTDEIEDGLENQTEADEVIAEAPPEKAEEVPRDDIIAEADVYLAYGIYQQAEDLLKKAITDNPDNDAYRAKLAETHYASKNADAFLEIATELNERVDADSATWKKIVVMGQDLCADDPMFLGAVVADMDLNATSPSEQVADFGADETLSESDSLELPEMETVSAETIEDESVEEIEFNLSDTGALETDALEDGGAVEEEFSLDIDASELDIETEASEAETAEEEGFEVSEIDISLDAESSESNAADDAQEVNDLDFNLDDTQDDEASAVATEDAGEPEEEISLDLSEEIEIDSETDSSEEVAAVTAANDDSDDEEFDFSNRDDDDEISTKLDLARAYLDMGDHEGTKDILDEVIADGNDEQKQEANELMAKLG